LLLLVCAPFVHVLPASAATSGPNNPTTGADDTSSGTVAWGTPTNVVSSNNAYATAVLPTINTLSHYLKVTGYGFAIPTNATINGILVEVEKSEASVSSATIVDNAIYAVKGGTIQTGGTNQKSASTWPTTDAYTSYGSGSDLWGVAWTPADINASTFGVAIQSKNNGASGSETARVDHARITITYSLPTYTQASYHWYANADNVQPGSSLAAQSTAASTLYSSPVRLRTGLTVGTANMPAASQAFGLQYSTSTSGPWTDVAASGWYNNAWSYKMPLSVSNGNASTLTNYQVLATVNTSALVTASKMKSDCSDMRFTDTDGTTLLNYWIESGCNTTTTKVWVKVPSIGASATKNIFMYYGDASATSAADGTQTFQFFDDFSTFDSSKWTSSGSSSVASGALTVSSGSVYTNNTWGSMPGYVVEANVKWSNFSSSLSGLDISTSQSTQGGNAGSNKLTYFSTGGAAAAINSYAADGTAASYNINGGTTQFTATANTATTIGYAITPSQVIYYNNRTQTNAYAGTWSGSAYLWLGYFAGSGSGASAISPLVTDWVLVRQYAASAVTATAGTEQARTDWRYYSNPTPADGATVTSNLLTGATVLESYNGSSPTPTNPNAINSGSTGEWDFPLDASGVSANTYYLRMVKSGGTALDTYTVYPQITVTSDTAPNSPSTLTQQKVDTTTISTGGWINSTSVVFGAQASDTDNPDTLQLCVEKKPIGTGFSNTEDSCGTGVAYAGSAVSASVTLGSLADGTQYHWQARVRDAAGLYSGWVSYGGNAESASDFGIDTTPPAAAGTVDISTDGTYYGPWHNIFSGGGTQKILQGLSNKVFQQIPQVSTSAGVTHAGLTTSIASYGDLTFQTDINNRAQLRTGSAPNAWEMGWPVWHYTDNTHFYNIVLKTNGWELDKEDPAYAGNQRFLTSGSSPTFPLGTPNTVKIQQVSNVITVWVNGTLLTTFTDNERPYLTGSIGLYTEDAKVDWDNITVYSYP
jgi:hypothetical protein